MTNAMKAKEPFRFYTRLHLSELTGLKASTVSQLVRLIKKVSGSSIYHHTHRFLLQHQYLSPEPPNDFAYWIAQELGEKELAERLASIDTIQFSTIRNLREKIAETIERYLLKNPLAKLKFARAGQEFYFIKSISFALPTKYVANDLEEFATILGKITIDSIYFHVFDARLRLGKETNDFSYWIRTSYGDEKIAGQIERLDPYTYTLEDLRRVIMKIIERKIQTT